jgi:sporulation protein YlmC with PRC-barrel domain
VIFVGKFVIAKQLAGKALVSNDGEGVGRIVDLSVNEVTGKIMSIIAEGNPDSVTARKMRKEDGMLVIPYSSVLAVGDYIILDKKALSAA